MTGQPRIYLLVTASVILLLAGYQSASAQAPVQPSPPTVADLERRIRELELRLQNVTLPPPTPVAQPSAPGGAPSVDRAGTPASTPAPSPSSADPSPSGSGASEAKVDSGATTDSSPPKGFAGWDNGFYLRSADKQFSLRVTGQIQGDFRAYTNGGDRTDIDTFVIRRARFGLEATLFQFYEFRFLPDFGSGQTRLQDAFMNVHYWDELQVEGGRFKQPFSYEQLIQDRFVPFMERSLIDQVTPQRDVGLMVHGQRLFDGRFDYGVSVSNGEQNGDTDISDHKDIAARLAIRPFAPRQDSILRNLMLGMAVTTGVQNEPVQPNVLRTPLGVPFFQFNSSVYADGLRNRWSPEIAYFFRGFGMSAQYFLMTQEMRASFTGAGFRQVIDVPFGGYYVQGSYLLTGETRSDYSEAITPLRPFDPRPGHFGPGAWELVTRISHLKVGNDVFLPGAARLADPTKFSNGATELTLGFNWYLNQWMRVQFNWERSWFDQPVQLGPDSHGRFLSHDTLGTRLQLIF